MAYVILFTKVSLHMQYKETSESYKSSFMHNWILGGLVIQL